MDITTQDWINFFPYAAPRPEQEKVINFALNALVNDDKRFVILDCGTGIGKSAIGFTIAQWYNQFVRGNGAYYLTTQKVLQEQYMKDFAKDGMMNLQSANNFTCKYYKFKTCAQSRMELKATQDDKFKKICMGGCKYVKAKKEFIEGQHGITNFAYFMAETNYAGHLEKRTMMVVDECHNTEIQLGNFVEVSFSEFFASSKLKLSPPKHNSDKTVINWVIKEYKPALSKLVKHFSDTIEKMGLKANLKEFVQVSRQYDMLQKHFSKVETFLDVYQEDNWVMNVIETEGRGKLKFEFKPIHVGPYSEDKLFRMADKVVMMSATVMHKEAFCEVLGIPEDRAAYIHIPSPFPVENRPIIVSPAGSMSYKNIDKTLPAMVAAIKEILKSHPNAKGIIHTNSFKIASYIRKNIRSKRLLFHNSEDREKVLKKHIADPRATVLVSPSMQEGVDLKGNLSEFQIICKVPFPYLGDKLVKKRMTKWEWWYPLQTAKVIVQSVGRSIRSENDQAVTYVLDGDWDYYWKKHKGLFPQEFIDTVHR